MGFTGFLASCEGCGWQSPIAYTTRATALEAARDHEYNKGCPARGELSPSILQAKMADAVKQQVHHQRMAKRRDKAARQGLIDPRTGRRIGS